MLHKSNRLAKDMDIAQALKRGRGFFNPFFTLKFLSKASGKRFGVVVSTKVFKSAVKRNRLKRLTREHLRKSLTAFRAGDYVIIAKPKISSAPEKEILSALADVCRRVK